MTVHHAGRPMADRRPDRHALVIAADLVAARHLIHLIEMTGLVCAVDHHCTVSAAIASGATGLAVLDASPPSAETAAQVGQLRQAGIVTVLVILPATAAAMVPSLIEAGADAVLNGGDSADDLRAIIRSARAGYRSVAESLTRDWRACDAAVAPCEVLARLTPRQRQIARALVTGTPTKVIAHDLGLSDGTVKIHATAIYQRLAVRNRTALAHLFASASGH